jgi:hypothetical protein
MAESDIDNNDVRTEDGFNTSVDSDHESFKTTSSVKETT